MSQTYPEGKRTGETGRRAGGRGQPTNKVESGQGPQKGKRLRDLEEVKRNSFCNFP